MDYKFTDLELQQAAAALNVIEQKGDPHEFEHVIAHCADNGNGRWVPGSPRYVIACKWAADELARLLGESKERCLRAVEAVFGGDWQRAVFRAILSYANELTRQQAEPDPDPVGTFTNNMLETYERYGLDAMLDYHCGRLGPPYDTVPEPARRQAESPKEEVRFVRMGGAV